MDKIHKQISHANSSQDHSIDQQFQEYQAALKDKEMKIKQMYEQIQENRMIMEGKVHDHIGQSDLLNTRKSAIINYKLQGFEIKSQDDSAIPFFMTEPRTPKFFGGGFSITPHTDVETNENFEDFDPVPPKRKNPFSSQVGRIVRPKIRKSAPLD